MVQSWVTVCVYVNYQVNKPLYPGHLLLPLQSDLGIKLAVNTKEQFLLCELLILPPSLIPTPFSSLHMHTLTHSSTACHLLVTERSDILITTMSEPQQTNSWLWSRFTPLTGPSPMVRTRALAPGICVCVCVCACVHACVHVCACVCMCVCVYVGGGMLRRE